MRARRAVLGRWLLLLLLLPGCDLYNRVEPPLPNEEDAQPVKPVVEPTMQPIEDWHPDPVVTQERMSTNGNGKYQVYGVEYEPWGPIPAYEETGLASWRGEPYDGFTTLSGEVFDIDDLMAAHRHLPIPSYIRVTNPLTSASTVVRVNDRGPFHVEAIVDLSQAAAEKIGLLDTPDTEVHIELINDEDLPVFFLETNAIYGVDQVRELTAEFSRLQNVNSVVLPQSNTNWFRIRLGPFGNVEDAKRVRGWGILNTDTESTILEE